MFAFLARRPVVSVGMERGSNHCKSCRLQLQGDRLRLEEWRSDGPLPGPARVGLNSHLSVVQTIGRGEDPERFFSFSGEQGLVRVQPLSDELSQLGASPLTLPRDGVYDLEVLAVVTACRQAHPDKDSYGILHLGVNGRCLIVADGPGIRSHWCGYWPENADPDELGLAIQQRMDYCRLRRWPLPEKFLATGEHTEWCAHLPIAAEPADPLAGIAFSGHPPSPRLAAALGLALRQLNPPGLRYAVCRADEPGGWN
ncbi:MAG: hypothetical protein U0931_11175 [Vulcanimicrobiota bacterium]